MHISVTQTSSGTEATEMSCWKFHRYTQRDISRQTQMESNGNTDGWQQALWEDAISIMHLQTEIVRARRFTFQSSTAHSTQKEQNWNQKQEYSHCITRQEHSSEHYALQRATSGVWMMYGRCTCSIHCSL